MPRTKGRPGSRAAVTPGGSNGPVPEVLTLAEAATYLRLPEEEVVRAVRELGLAARAVGPEWRFSREAIQDWLRTGPARPRSSKEALVALAGKYKDDPDLQSIYEEALRRRDRATAGDD